MLEDGDIMNIDITVYVDGYHGDTSRTFLVGTKVVSHPFFSTPESNSSPVSLV
jgi:methionine aminopeptidase